MPLASRCPRPRHVPPNARDALHPMNGLKTGLKIGLGAGMVPQCVPLDFQGMGVVAKGVAYIGLKPGTAAFYDGHRNS